MVWLASLLAAAPSLAVEIPAFSQGLWEYERSVGSSKFVAKECGDPSRDMRANNAAMEKIGCKLSASTQAGATYTYTRQCAVKLPSGVVSWTTTSTLTAEGETAYRLEAHSSRGPSDEIIVARRVGDCDK